MSRADRMRLFMLLFVLLCVLPSMVFAQANMLPGQIVPDECNGIGGCQNICTVATIAQNVLNTGIYIAVFLSAVLFAWAGWLYLTSLGNSGQHSKAVSVFTNVAIGLVIILGGWLVVDTLMRTLVNSDARFGPWNKICALFMHATGLA